MKYINIKKAIFLAILIIPSISFASIDANLKYGAKGQEVTELQEFLIAGNFLNTTASGNFFSLTRNAVIAYQKSVNLPSTGYVGPLTREKINAELLADDTASNQDEINQTGTVTAPVNTTNSAILQSKIDDLNKQIQISNSLLQQQNQQKNQIMQNTTPPVNTPVFGGVPDIIIPTDCTPVLEAQNIYEAGNLDTGISMMFVGTSTFPVGCKIEDIQNNLQTNQVLYHGPVSAWKRNGDIRYIPGGFTFRQGWGIIRDSEGLSGNIVWYVGSSSLVVSYNLSNQ